MTTGLPQRIPEPHSLAIAPLMPEPVHQPLAPPAYSSRPPPSGYRLALATTAPFPDTHETGPPPCVDLDGSSVYFGSALFEVVMVF
jgi:hypothetical protein